MFILQNVKLAAILTPRREMIVRIATNFMMQMANNELSVRWMIEDHFI